jgi:hypothetical protein
VDGVYSCQHGAEECTTDVYELCALYKLSGNLKSIELGDTTEKAWSFMYCMEQNHGDPAYAQSCFTSTMSQTTLTWSAIEECARTESNAVQFAASVATPSHDYVPWILIDHKPLQNTKTSTGLVNAICRAYTGPKPIRCLTGEPVLRD